MVIHSQVGVLSLGKLKESITELLVGKEQIRITLVDYRTICGRHHRFYD